MQTMQAASVRCCRGMEDLHVMIVPLCMYGTYVPTDSISTVSTLTLNDLYEVSPWDLDCRLLLVARWTRAVSTWRMIAKAT